MQACFYSAVGESLLVPLGPERFERAGGFLNRRNCPAYPVGVVFAIQMCVSCFATTSCFRCCARPRTWPMVDVAVRRVGPVNSFFMGEACYGRALRAKKVKAPRYRDRVMHDSIPFRLET